MSSQVVLKMEDGVAVLSVNRPEALNALNTDIIKEIDDKIEQIKANDAVKVLVFYNEKNFAAGADIKAMVECNSQQAKEFVFNPTYDKIQCLCIPTIAAIEGYALGGGMELACACDFRIAAENAKMGFPEITLGIMPGAGGTIRLPRLIGESRAKEMILFGKKIDALEAERIGLVNLVVDNEDVLKTAMQWADKLKRRPKVAVGTAKKSIENSTLIPDGLKAIEQEAALWASLFETYDQKEGMRAFIEKRKPVFKDK